MESNNKYCKEKGNAGYAKKGLKNYTSQGYPKGKPF